MTSALGRIKRGLLFALKALLLLFVARMMLLQVPELLYDISGPTPVRIEGPQDLAPGRFKTSTFVNIAGRPDFTRAFVLPTHGLRITSFPIEPYGMNLIARTYDKVDEEWEKLDHFVGRLRPFKQQPFRGRIQKIFLGQYQREIPEGAYVLTLYDVPHLSGWQVGAVIFAGLLWALMFFFFFVRRRHIVPAEY